jgi:hypothetical protein
MNNLVGGENADNFISLAATEIGRKAFLGDHTKLDSDIGPKIVNANISLRDATDKIIRLVDDPTRTEVKKHEAAKQIADKTIKTLEDAKGEFISRAESLMQRAKTLVDIEFSPTENKGTLYSDIRNWISKQSNEADGIEKIRQAAKGNKDIAAVLWHSPAPILGLADTVLNSLQEGMIIKYIPEAASNVAKSQDLSKLVPKYDETIRKIRASFFNPGLAEQAKLRVEV